MNEVWIYDKQLIVVNCDKRESKKKNSVALKEVENKFIPHRNKPIKQVIAQIINVSGEELVTLFCLVLVI